MVVCSSISGRRMLTFGGGGGRASEGQFPMAKTIALAE